MFAIIKITSGQRKSNIGVRYKNTIFLILIISIYEDSIKLTHRIIISTEGISLLQYSILNAFFNIFTINNTAVVRYINVATSHISTNIDSTRWMNRP